MDRAAFRYDLPPELIAQAPLAERSAGRPAGSRGGPMPQGDFVYDPYGSGFQERAHEIYRVLRDLHPVYENPERGFFAISRFADVWQATQDVDALTTEGVEESRSLRPMLNYLDPPRHDRLRRDAPRLD